MPLVKTNVHGVTGDAVVRLPGSTIVKPYVLVGGGNLIFDPRDAGSMNKQVRGAFVYGGGVDMPLVKRLALRGQYRGFLYKIPDFGQSQLLADKKLTHTAVPSVGLAYTF